ncbi:MAG: Cell wall assembly regulator [Trizodia sp. TS-e1964]|nr:MAG: Cell wall assembly regulator [Trizodia sp. TS-e1964]
MTVLSSIGDTWRSFWHTMTSYDRHASYDSPYRTGQHVPLSQSRHAPLTSITTAFEPVVDVTSNSPYTDNPSRHSDPLSARSNNFPHLPSHQSPTSPYFPGSRSNTAQLHRDRSRDSGPIVGAPGEIQLQSFHEGLPPPPPVAHSWKRIDRWAEENYEELFDQLAEGATNNDINELEHQLNFSLPLEVRESLQIHDGQERGGLPTGIIFSSMLLDCEEIYQEWLNWKTVNSEYLTEPVYRQQITIPKTFTSSAPSSSKQPPQKQAAAPLWRQDLQAKQDSQPTGAIQKVYTNPAWIPLIRDWGGNNVAVDLAPGPAGKWGQVILIGRDYDCKYVIARSWSAFLAIVADDLSSDKWWVDEDTQELKLREFKDSTVEPGYLDILRWRMDQKYGRKVAQKKRPASMNLNTNPNIIGSGNSSGHGSPSESPTRDQLGGERGRSLHRFENGVPPPSPRRGGPKLSSPLSRVVEDMPLPIPIQTSKLVEVATPRESLESKDADNNPANSVLKENLKLANSGATSGASPSDFSEGVRVLETANGNVNSDCPPLPGLIQDGPLKTIAI